MRRLPSFANFGELQELMCRHQIGKHAPEATYKNNFCVNAGNEDVRQDLLRRVSSISEENMHYKAEDSKKKCSGYFTFCGSPKSTLTHIDSRDDCQSKRDFSLVLPSFFSTSKQNLEIHLGTNEANTCAECEFERNYPRGFRFFLPSKKKCSDLLSDDGGSGASITANEKKDLDKYSDLIDSCDSQDDKERDDQMLSISLCHFDPLKLVFTSSPQDIPIFTPTKYMTSSNFLPSAFDLSYSFAFEASVTMKKDDEWGQFLDLSSDEEEVLDRKTSFTFASLVKPPE